MADPVAPAVERDPWEDDQFAPLDTRTGPEHFASELADIANNEPGAAPPIEDPAVVSTVESVVETPAAPPAPQYAPPESFAVEGGGTVTYEEDAQGWHATLEYKNGEPIEVFHARTPLELSKQLAVGKLNASKKINQLNKQVKLVRKVDEPKPQPAATAQPTADQLFEIKTLAQTDLYAAFNKMLQITAGVDFNSFVNWVKEGKAAKAELEHQKIVSQWMSQVNYYRTANNDERIGKYLDDYQLPLTVENLVKAHTELSEAGLLDEAPKPTPKPQPRPEVVATTPTPAPVAAPPVTPVVPAAPARIERPAGRANATLGLRVGETTIVRPQPEPKVPSAEELDELPTGDIEQLFAAVRRTKAQQSARR